METFSLMSIVIIAALAAAVIVGAVVHSRALKKAIVSADKRHVRGLHRYRH